MRSQAAGDGAATLKRLVEEVDAEIAACQATIERDQRWERRRARSTQGGAATWRSESWEPTPPGSCSASQPSSWDGNWDERP